MNPNTRNLLLIVGIIALAGLGGMIWSGSVSSWQVVNAAPQWVTISDPFSQLEITPSPNTGFCDFYEPPPGMFQPATFDESITDPPFDQGVAYNIEVDSFSNFIELVGDRTARFEVNVPIQGEYRVYHHAPEEATPITIRYYVFLNQIQLTEVFVDEPEGTAVKTITLGPKEQARFTMQLPPLPDGTHELLVIGIEDAPVRRFGMNSNYMQRVTLLAGEHPPMERAYRLMPYVDLPHLSGNGSGITLNVTLNESLETWAGFDVYLKAREELSFEVHFGYAGTGNSTRHDHQTVALIMLLNDQQIPVQPDQMAFYGAVNPGTVNTDLPVTVDLSPLESGQHRLTLIRINYPNVPVCLLRAGIGFDSYYFDPGDAVSVYGIEVPEQ